MKTSPRPRNASKAKAWSTAWAFSGWLKAKTRYRLERWLNPNKGTKGHRGVAQSSSTMNLTRHVGEVVEQHPVDEDVAATHLLQENQIRAVVEELNEVEWRIAL